MVQVRLSHLSMCACVVVLAACEAPPQESAPAAAQEHRAEMLAPVDSDVAAAFSVRESVTVPQDEALHVAAIARLMNHPRPDAHYAEQVKLLTSAYLDKYPDSAENRQLAMQCFIQAILLQPERFSGSDFDRAYEFCDYPQLASMIGHSRLFKVELKQVDYRCSAEEKQAALSTVQNIVKTPVQEGGATDVLAHAYYVAAKYATPEQRQDFILHYLQHADHPGLAYRLRLLQLAEMAPQELLPYVIEEAEYAAAEVDALLPLVCVLLEDEGIAASLSRHPILGALATAARLEKLLDTPDADRSALDLLAGQLSQGTAQSLYVCSVLARYYLFIGQPESTIAIYRTLKAQAAPLTPQTELLYAEALAATADGALEAEAVYRSLSLAPEPEIALSALGSLLTMLENQRRYKEAFDVTDALLRAESNTDKRVLLLFKRAELAELTGNINEAISLYSMLENNYGGDLTVALPACQKLLQLLSMRNFKSETNREKGTYTPSDKWYAWVRGRDFVKRVRQNAESEIHFTESQKLIFEDICKMVDSLGKDKDVISEERARAMRDF